MKESSPAAEIRYVKTQETGLGALGLCLIEELFLLDFLFIYFVLSFDIYFYFLTAIKVYPGGEVVRLRRRL